MIVAPRVDGVVKGFVAVRLHSETPSHIRNLTNPLGNSPEGEPPFLPVDLGDIFPEKPPAEDNVNFDLQLLGGDHSHGDPDQQEFGFVLIDGPSQAVTSMNKRDGSHLEFINCADVRSANRQTVRFVCTQTGDGSNCDNIMEGGVAGTVVKMPSGCGPGTYAVAHSVEVAKDQTLPRETAAKGYKNSTVLEMTFDYDFGLVRRDSGEIYLRIDYSNIPGYWSTMVDSPGQAKRSLEERFWSNSASAWGSRITAVRGGSDLFTELQSSIKQSIYTNAIDCNGGSKAFLDLQVEGIMSARLRTGLSIEGTIQPFHIDEAYSFVDAQMDLTVDYDLSVYGNLDLSGYKEEPLLRTPATKIPFNHPGIISINPFLQAQVGFAADIELAGNFSMGYHAATNGYLTQVYPSSVEKPTGNMNLDAVDNSINGQITDGSSGRVKIDMRPQVGLEIEMEQYGTDGDLFDATITGSFDSYAAAEIKPDGSYQVSIGSDAAVADLEYKGGSSSTIGPWDDDANDSRLVGPAPGAKQLAAGSPGDDDNHPGGPRPHEIDFDSGALFAVNKGLLTCPNNLKNGGGSDDESPVGLFGVLSIPFTLFLESYTLVMSYNLTPTREWKC